MSSKTYYQRKDLGLCVRCGIPIDNGKCQCEECLAKTRQTKAELRKVYKKYHICTVCGHADAFVGSLCEECSRKNKVYMQSRKTQEFKAKEKARHRQRYLELKAKGLCVFCGKRPSETGKTKCPVCAAKERQRSEKDRRKKGIMARQIVIESGRCIFCQEPVYKQYKVCEKHYERMVYMSHKAQENR